MQLCGRADCVQSDVHLKFFVVIQTEAEVRHEERLWGEWDARGLDDLKVLCWDMFTS